ncbi:MAG: hypothetical protein RL033_130, partial [Pseudomonadota bacterium]
MAALSRAGHSRRVSALVCRTAAWLLGLTLAASSGSALAADRGGDPRDATEPTEAPAAKADSRSGWSVGTALHTPLSLGILSEDEINQAALLMTGLDAELCLGGRVGYSSRLGYELAAG